MDVIVENIVLLRDEAGFADLVAEVVFISYCDQDDVFFDHDRVRDDDGDLLYCRCVQPEPEYFDYLHNGGELRVTGG